MEPVIKGLNENKDPNTESSFVELPLEVRNVNICSDI